MLKFPFLLRKRRDAPTVGVFTPGSEAGPNRALTLLHAFSGTDFRFFFDRSLAKASNLLLERPLSWKDFESGEHRLSPAEKAESFHRLSVNENVDIIWGFDGPEGTIETIKHIDWELIQKNPKIVIGFSDISAFLNAITSKTGTPTIHAENLSSVAPKGTNFSALKKILKGKRISLTSDFLNDAYTTNDPYAYTTIGHDLQNPELENISDPPAFMETLSLGKAKGKLIGGNLTRLCELHNIGIIPSYEESILFLEDTAEHIGTIENRLSSLERMGVFHEIRGLIIGDFNNISKGSFHSDNRLGDLFNRLAAIMERQGKPCIAGFPVGHVRLASPHDRRLFPLPIGINSILKAEKKSSILEFEPLPPEFRI